MAGRSRRVAWTPGARRDLEEVLAHIASDSTVAASSVLDVVLKTADSLGELSERGRRVPEHPASHLREVFVYSYRLIYRVLDREVQVVAIVHGARLLDRRPGLD